MNNNKELFIDQSCALCNSFGIAVQNHSGNIKISSNEMLTDDIYALDSIVFKDDNILLIGMDAILVIVNSWGGWYRLIRVTKFLPNSFNHFVYRFIARNRHQIAQLRSTNAL